MPTFTNTIVGTAAVRVLAEDGMRKSYVLVNRGTVNIFLGNSSAVTAVATSGFQVEPGQAFAGEDDPTDEIWAISTIAAQNLNVSTIP